MNTAPGYVSRNDCCLRPGFRQLHVTARIVTTIGHASFWELTWIPKYLGYTPFDENIPHNLGTSPTQKLLVRILSLDNFKNVRLWIQHGFVSMTLNSLTLAAR